MAIIHRIQRSLTGVGGWADVDTVAEAVDEYSDTGLTPATDYFYRVRTENGDVVSAWSNIASATTDAGQTVWSYATLAAAEASGDPWANNDIIRITDPSPDVDFVYSSAAAVNGDSGLHPRYPFGDSQENVGYTYVDGMGPGTDPGASTWTDASTGTEGVHYLFSINTSPNPDTCKMWKLTNTIGICRLNQATITSARTVGALKFRGALAGFSGTGAGNDVQIYFCAYVNGAGGDPIIALRAQSADSNWEVLSGAGLATVTGTGLSFGTQRNLAMYITAGKWSLWKDETLVLSGTDPLGTTAPYGAALIAGSSPTALPTTLEFVTVTDGYLATA